MGFGDVLTVFILFVILPAVVFDGVKKVRAVKGGSGGDLRASELQALIREAVEDAVAPLISRVADLEERLGDESAGDLRARLDPRLLDAPDPTDDPLATERARTRA